MNYINIFSEQKHTDDVIEFKGKGIIDGKETEISFKTLGRFIEHEYDYSNNSKITIFPLTDEDGGILKIRTIQEDSVDKGVKGLLKEFEHVINFLNESMLEVIQELDSIEEGSKEASVNAILDLKSLLCEYEKAKIVLKSYQ